MNAYIWITIIILTGWALIRFTFQRVLESTKKVGPEHINVSVCPICGSLETTTSENDASGFNLKCKNCNYTGRMLEMNLIQAKKYEETRHKEQTKTE